MVLGEGPDRNRRCSTRCSGAHDVVGDHHGLCLQLARSQRLTIGRLIGAQNDRFTVERCTPVSIELDLVQQPGAQRRPASERRLAGQDEARSLGTGSERAGNGPDHTQSKGGEGRGIGM